MLLYSRDEVRERGLTRPTEPAAPEIKTVSPSFNLPTSNIPYGSAQLAGGRPFSRPRGTERRRKTYEISGQSYTSAQNEWDI
jgi:hypothetical protein